MNLKTAYLLLIMILCPINLVNSQTSVCELGKGQMCVSYSYLRKKAVTLSTGSDKEKYIGDNVRLGLDYGFTDSLKLSLLPDLRIVSSDDDDSVPQIAPAIGAQAMLVSKPLPSFLGLSLFAVGSGKLQYSRLDIDSKGLITEDPSIGRNIATEGILGVGASRKIEIFGSIPFTFFTEGYYEFQYAKIPEEDEEEKERKTSHTSWIELGAEVKICDEIILIPKFRTRIYRQDSALHYSDAFLTMTVAIEN